MNHIKTINSIEQIEIYHLAKKSLAINSSLILRLNAFYT